jgi:hypothetical protein
LRHKVSDETPETTRETRVLQTTGQIVDAGGALLLFAPGERMNWTQTEADPVSNVGGANSFRACFGGLVGSLLRAERVNGLFMIACIKPT